MGRFEESVQFLYSLANEARTTKLGLERIGRLLEALGNPHQTFRAVHVAGTNGKGSTCAMIASALRCSGYRTGLYTSPHLQDPRERIRIDGQPVSEQEFVWAFDQVRSAVRQLESQGQLDRFPSYFETVTAMGFLLFHRAQVEWAVVEVGLGGRLDATNVLQPQLTVITPIDYDHEAYLGVGLDSIAAEKAGILKPGVPVVVSKQLPEPARVIRQRARELGCRLVEAATWQAREPDLTPRYNDFVAVGPDISLRIRCPLAGEHQLDNALTAVAALWELGVAPEAIRQGLEQVHWPGRLEVVRESPLVVLDGAHNPAGARSLARYLQRFFGDRKIWVALGLMRDKAIDEIAGVLTSVAHRVLLVPIRSPRALSTEAALEFFSDHPRVELASDSRQILSWIRQASPEDVVVVTGSLWLAGEVRSWFVG